MPGNGQPGTVAISSDTPQSFQSPPGFTKPQAFYLRASRRLLPPSKPQALYLRASRRRVTSGQAASALPPGKPQALYLRASRRRFSHRARRVLTRATAPTDGSARPLTILRLNDGQGRLDWKTSFLLRSVLRAPLSRSRSGSRSRRHSNSASCNALPRRIARASLMTGHCNESQKC